jgi:hypothetical protein
MIKSFEEHPILDHYRKIGIDPERLESFEIRYSAKARKWLLLEQTEIQAASSLFENFYEMNESRILAANNGKEVSIPFFARDEILALAPRYAGDSDFLSFDHLSSGASEREVKLLHLAASHLFANGVPWVMRIQEDEPSCAVADIANRDDFVLPEWKPMLCPA